MGLFKHKYSSVRAVVYFNHPSGREDRWLRAMYEVDEQEFAQLQKAFSDFEEGARDKKFHVLRLANKHQVTLRLDEISDIIRGARYGI